MTQTKLPSPWGQDQKAEGNQFDLEAAIDGAVAMESRRKRASEIIDQAHEECKQILASRFDDLVRLALPESLLNTLRYEIEPSTTIFLCTCKLYYLDHTIYLSRPTNSLSDWRLMCDGFPHEYCSGAQLGQMLMLYLDRLRRAWGDAPFDDLPEMDGDDDDAVVDIYFAG